MRFVNESYPVQCSDVHSLDCCSFCVRERFSRNYFSSYINWICWCATRMRRRKNYIFWISFVFISWTIILKKQSSKREENKNKKSLSLSSLTKEKSISIFAFSIIYCWCLMKKRKFFLSYDEWSLSFVI